MAVNVPTVSIVLLCIYRVIYSLGDISFGEGNPSISDEMLLPSELASPVEQSVRYTEEQRDIVDRLNAGRRDVTPTATDMLKVEWDSDLAAAAADVLDSCFFSVSLPENINLQVDKNVIQATGITRNSTFYLPEALSFWLDYGKDVYVFDTFDCQADDKIICKMYKLLTWSTMYKVGCSQRFCPELFDSFSSNTEENYIYWKCNFANIGRFWDDGNAYSANGDACTECPDGKGWCSGGLCVNSCSSKDGGCYCALSTTCFPNGQFFAENCSCECNPGYRGNTCQASVDSVEEPNDPRSIRNGPFHSSSTSFVLATSTPTSTHPTVVGSFHSNDDANDDVDLYDNIIRREERDADLMYTMDTTTYEVYKSTETEPTTYLDHSTSQPTTVDFAETTEDVTWASSTYETTVYMSTVEDSTTSFHEETTLLESTPALSTIESDDETTAEMSSLAVSSTESSEETTVDATTFHSTPARSSTEGFETTEEEVTEPWTDLDEQEIATTTDEATTTEEAPPSCTLSCGGEGRLDEDSCSCECDEDDYTYNETASACLVCGFEVPCNGSGILDIDTCTCYCASGYQGPSCDSVCNITDTDCWADYSDPEEELVGDYCPAYCPYCNDCSAVTCANEGYGDKIEGFEAERGMCRCYCPRPWSGINCDECNLICLNGGSLNATDCSCQCLPGFSGLHCSDTCRQTSMLCTNNARPHCDQPLIAKHCPQMCGLCSAA